MSVADQVKADKDPYHRAIALMLYRRINREDDTVTMFFDDGSLIKFRILYKVLK